MRLPILLLLSMSTCIALAQGNLTVEIILNKPTAGGELKVALCPSKDAYDDEVGCTLRTVKASGNTVSCTFNDLTPGNYAVKVFHDINSNGKLDTSWIGWPQEPYGFSNDAPVNMGPPSFKLAALTVKQGAQTSRISLR
ncbi:MAG: DUF2141 domain-containing protein [Flavobacteriales bacterium]|nr:DUF2141 domain-containing protein [Flavobacteriales bacterium]